MDEHSTSKPTSLQDELLQAAESLGLIPHNDLLENRVYISLLDSLRALEEQRSDLCEKFARTGSKTAESTHAERNHEPKSDVPDSFDDVGHDTKFSFGPDNYNHSDRSKFYSRLLDIEKKLKHEISVLDDLVQEKTPKDITQPGIIQNEVIPAESSDHISRTNGQTASDDTDEDEEHEDNEDEDEKLEEMKDSEGQDNEQVEDVTSINYSSFFQYGPQSGSIDPGRDSDSACWIIIHRMRESDILLLKPSCYLDELGADIPLGKIKIDSEKFLSEHRNIAFVVYRDYRRSFNWLYSGIYDFIGDSDLSKSSNPSIEHHHSETIEIISDEMKETIQSFKKLLPAAVSGEWFKGDKMDKPYLPLFHYLPGMKDTTDPELCTPKHQTCLTLLTDFVNQHCTFNLASALISRGSISSEHFTKLFLPGDVVVDSWSDPPIAYICDELPETGTSTVVKSLTFKASRFQFDGKLRLRSEKLECSFPDSAVTRISELRIYPIKYSTTELRERLETRSKKFWMCRQKSYVCYEDLESDAFRSGYGGNPRFMIDYDTYRELHPDADVFQNVSGTELPSSETENDEPPVGPQRYIMPPSVVGFAIHDKKWRSLLVDNITPISWNKSAFEKLVLKPAAKELIQALVTVHMVGKRSSDMIEGKGNGLLILLHGPPGTGKTLTAESVAELVQRPLYRVTCGDIGTDAEGVEAYLESVLHIGKIWGCVVLLDEADVFLEERSLADLQRNALVSVFLRILEYYEGILILTSNRVGTFDEAFKSRFKLTLHYTSFTKVDRRKVWRNFIKMMRDNKEENVDCDDLEDNLDNLAEYTMNGREIRNAISTSKELALFRKQSLGYEHLQHVIHVASDFEKYLEQTRGWSADEWQKEQGVRS